jgi:hypothetical protein
MERDSITVANHDDRVVTRHHSLRQTEKGRTLPRDEREKERHQGEGEVPTHDRLGGSTTNLLISMSIEVVDPTIFY